MVRRPLLMLALAALAAGPPLSAEEPTPQEIVAKAVASAGAGNYDDQAWNLARLAWPEPGAETPEAVRNLARQKLVAFGTLGMGALGRMIRSETDEHRLDVVRALLEAREFAGGPTPSELVPALEHAVWAGDRETRRVAIPMLGMQRARYALVTIIDAASEDPELLEISMLALARIGDDRARFFLEQVLLEGPEPMRPKAAVALARIGRRARLALKRAMKSDSRETREIAVRALLPVANAEDLGALYEYTYTHGDHDDPELIEVVRASAFRLEALLSGALESQGEDDGIDP